MTPDLSVVTVCVFILMQESSQVQIGRGVLFVGGLDRVQRPLLVVIVVVVPSSARGRRLFLRAGVDEEGTACSGTVPVRPAADKDVEVRERGVDLTTGGGGRWVRGTPRL